ncbi:MAG: ribonuclease P protein component [Bacteroidales bacterium]|nr:ribonuclease P protein component [Bacteroidales bacterium]
MHAEKISYCFRKQEHLCSKKQIDLLFSKAKSFNSGCLRVLFITGNDNMSFPIQVLFSVSKKRFSRAVDRNRIKRKMREAYRLNKAELYNIFKEKRLFIQVGFLYVSDEINSYKIIERDMIKALGKIISFF